MSSEVPDANSSWATADQMPHVQVTRRSHQTTQTPNQKLRQWRSIATALKGHEVLLTKYSPQQNARQSGYSSLTGGHVLIKEDKGPPVRQWLLAPTVMDNLSQSVSIILTQYTEAVLEEMSNARKVSTAPQPDTQASSDAVLDDDDTDLDDNTGTGEVDMNCPEERKRAKNRVASAAYRARRNRAVTCWTVCRAALANVGDDGGAVLVPSSNVAFSKRNVQGADVVYTEFELWPVSREIIRSLFDDGLSSQKANAIAGGQDGHPTYSSGIQESVGAAGDRAARVSGDDGPSFDPAQYMTVINTGITTHWPQYINLDDYKIPHFISRDNQYTEDCICDACSEERQSRSESTRRGE
jgi:hypothetical protein